MLESSSRSGYPVPGWVGHPFPRRVGPQFAAGPATGHACWTPPATPPSSRMEVLPTPSPCEASGKSKEQIPTIACASAVRCFALVGTGPVTALLGWDGRSWSIEPDMPFPRSFRFTPAASGYRQGASSAPLTFPRSALAVSAGSAAMACPGIAECVLVASLSVQNLAAGASAPGASVIASVWNGRSWSSTTMPFPNTRGEGLVQTGVVGQVSGMSLDVGGISCPSLDRCYVIGEAYYRTVDTPNHDPFAEEWNGRSWELLHVVVPSIDQSRTTLSGISCRTNSECYAVGGVANGVEGMGPATPLIAYLKGLQWSIKLLPNLQGTLNAISCSRPTCLAVGGNANTNADTGSETPLALAGTGSDWIPVASRSSLDTLTAVACRPAGDCVAIGDGSPIGYWDGTGILPLSPAAGTRRGALTAISCAGAIACFAAGLTPSGKTLVEAWAGGSWTRTPTPNVVSPNSVLSGIDCPIPTWCMAVGRHGRQTLSEDWDGSVWTVVPTANVPQATTNELHQVACPSVSLCIAVGDEDIGSYPRGMIEVWRGSGAWSIVTPQDLPPSGHVLNPDYSDVRAPSVTCAPASECFVYTGIYVDSWNGRLFQALPEAPIDVGTLSCPSAADCLAVDPEARVAWWNGTAWSPAPPIATTGTSSGNREIPPVAGSSCPSADDCRVVGTSQWQWNGVKWLSDPQVGPSRPELTAVSCASPALCVGVAADTSPPRAGAPVTQVWNGRVWSSLPEPGFNRSETAILSSVSCPATYECIAVGKIDDPFGGTSSLAVRIEM